jgi:histidyl-tRNA synthetase
LQEFVSITHLVDVSFIYYGGIENRKSCRFAGLNELLENVLVDSATVENVKNMIYTQLCSIKDYKGNTTSLIEKVKEELSQRGINQDQISIIENYLQIDGANEAKIEQLKKSLGNNPTAIKGIEELEYILAYHSNKYQSKIVVDVTLARGLNYYTGAIFEVAPPKEVSMGSIGGGGRYDDLTGIFGLKNMSGVGISFGLDRTYLVLEELNLFPETVKIATKALFPSVEKLGSTCENGDFTERSSRLCC